MTELRIALPKGKLFGESLKMLQKAGYDCKGDFDDGRQLIFPFPEQGVTLMVVRPTDIPTYVEYGAADVGIVGKDVLLEENREVYELLDLGFGECHFGLAVPKDAAENIESFHGMRVATKFPRVAKNFFAKINQQVEVIKLHGSVEIAPLVGLADAIVDIVSTGRTLAENNLVELVKIEQITARLIANRISYKVRFGEIFSLEQKIKNLIENWSKGEENNAADL